MSRGRGWGIPLLGGAGAIAWCLAIAWPFLASARALTEGGAAAVRPAAPIVTTIAWAVAVAAAAALVGWAPGRLLGRLTGRRGGIAVAAAYGIPICLPAYAVFYAWWQAWPAGSALHDMAVRAEIIPFVRHATLFIGLVAWSWPIVAWCVAGGVANEPGQLHEALRVDGASRRARLGTIFSSDARGLALGALLVLLLTFGNTTCFDLADVRTLGNELRIAAAEGAAPLEQIRIGAASILVAGSGAGVLWWLLRRRRPACLGEPGPPGRGLVIASLAIWFASLLGPLILLTARTAGPEQVRDFLRFYGAGFGRTLALAAASAVLLAALAVGLAAAWMDERRWMRRGADVLAIGWLVAALLPAHLVASALEAAYNVDVSLGPAGQFVGRLFGIGEAGSDSSVAALIYRRPAILVLGHLARLGFVAALVGRWLADREPETLRALRRLDGATTLRGFVSATGPRLVAAAIATGAVGLVIALGEVPVTARLQPPGFESITASILNAMHYQRPEIVLVALLAFLAIAVLTACVAAAALVPKRRLGSIAASCVGLVLVLGLGGCLPVDPAIVQPLQAEMTFGVAGRSLGQFNYPRGIAVDRAGEFVYVVDKNARVQRFGFDGVPDLGWKMPAMELGKPVGLNVAPNGNVYVADTHYFRVIAYTQEGEEVLRFGSHGREPGEFTYPTDVEFGAAGELFVSEYGGENDRIQVFTATGELLYTFGSFGSEVGQFNRPQSLLFNEARTELFVADAVNHRIVVVDPAGNTLRTIGEPGRGAGQLLHPYDLTMLEDGTLLVCEFTNHRVQRFSVEGAPLGLYGELGRGPGELMHPWGIDRSNGSIFILDSGNNRVQIVDRL